MHTPQELGIRKGTRIYPEEGLESRSHYLVKVASSSCNPIHRAVMYTGFVGADGQPRGHIYNPTYEPECLPVGHFYYVEVIQKLIGEL